MQFGSPPAIGLINGYYHIDSFCNDDSLTPQLGGCARVGGPAL
jgi:hypothetical protein